MLCDNGSLSTSSSNFLSFLVIATPYCHSLPLPLLTYCRSLLVFGKDNNIIVLKKKKKKEV